MGFNDSTLKLDDSPRERALQIESQCVCTAVYWDGKREGFVVTLHGKTIAAAKQAYRAWQEAEGWLLDRQKS